MSLFTALASAFGGYGQGRQQRTQDQLAQQQEADYQAQTAIEKQRATQEQQRFNIEQRQAGYDPNTGQQIPSSAKYLPIPSNATYDQIATLGARNYAIAVTANGGQGDPVGIANWGKFATTVPKGYQELTGGNVNQAKVGLVNAQAAAERDLPNRAREIAKGHDQTQITIAGQRFANNVALAQYNGAVKLGIANLAGAYHLQGINDQDAVRLAISDYQGKVSMYNSQNAATERAYGSYESGQAREGGDLGTQPPLTINVNAGQPQPTLNAPQTGGGGGGSAQPQQMMMWAPGGKANPQTVYDRVKGYLAKGTPIQTVLNAVNDYVKQGQLTQTQAAQIIQRMLLPGGGGGSNAVRNPTTKTPRISQRSIWQMAVDNGATPEEATKLAAIAIAESSGNPGSVNRTDNNGKQTSWGLFQISDGTHNEPANWNDPQVNMRMAIQKLRSQGFGAWGTYNTGAYKRYLPQGSG